MTSMWWYVIAAWVAVLGTLAIYGATTVAKGRRLSRQVPPEERRWS